MRTDSDEAGTRQKLAVGVSIRRRTGVLLVIAGTFAFLPSASALAITLPTMGPPATPTTAPSAPSPTPAAASPSAAVSAPVPTQTRLVAPSPAAVPPPAGTTRVVTGPATGGAVPGRSGGYVPSAGPVTVAPASLAPVPSKVGATAQSALVTAEDTRLRTLLRRGFGLLGPTTVATPGALPSLVLPARQAPYLVADLVAAGALRPEPAGTALLVKSVMALSGARLLIARQGLRTLRLESTPDGFATITTWGGALDFQGVGGPLAITSWDTAHNHADRQETDGRSYLRTIGGRMTLRGVNESYLGFWSGRTGGIAWTGLADRASTGGSATSSFVGNFYGSFASRSDHLLFTNDRFESNDRDGLRIHRGSNGDAVAHSTAIRNGSDGFAADRGTARTWMVNDTAIGNARNGFLLDGRSLATPQSASGTGTAVSIGTIIESNSADANAATGILVEGGRETIIRNNNVCARTVGIALRAGATETSLTGNNVRCGGRVALELGTGVTSTAVSHNTFLNAKTGILLNATSRSTITDNAIGAMSLLGISVRGASPRLSLTDNTVALLRGGRMGIVVRDAATASILRNHVSGVNLYGISIRGAAVGTLVRGNVISGRGPRAIDTKEAQPAPAVDLNDVHGWTKKNYITLTGYMTNHPELLIWVGIALMLILGWISSKRPRVTFHPYPQSTDWRPGPTNDLGAVTIEIVRPEHRRSARPVRPARPPAAPADAPRRGRPVQPLYSDAKTEEIPRRNTDPHRRYNPG